jgi:mannosyltransferase OCH1-like enzyme
MDSWHLLLPGYEFVLWDAQRAASIGSRYVDEAISYKKYAFAADFIRFYALYTYGGIYLDSDVEVLKPFDDLLALRYFIGKENSWNDWEPAIMGAEAGITWMKQVLAWWKNGKKPFVDVWGRPQMQVLPWVCSRQLKHFSIKDCNSIDEWSWADDYICRFPADWFSPKSWENLELMVTGNTYCIHHFAASWNADMPKDLILSPLQRNMRGVRACFSYLKHDLIKKRRNQQ